VVDSAKVNDHGGVDSDQVSVLRRQFDDVLAKIPANAWLATHKPVNAMLAKPRDPQVNIVSNQILQAALGADMPAGVRMYYLARWNGMQMEGLHGRGSRRS
jgi:hypothetical protein